MPLSAVRRSGRETPTASRRKTKSYGRALIYADVVVRVHRNYHLAMHVDTDEANAFNSDTEPYGVIVRFFDSNFNTDKWIEDELSGIRR